MTNQQGAPAAVAGCTRSPPHENMDSACRAKAAIAEMQNMAARGVGATVHDLERFVSMLTAALVEALHPAPSATAHVGDSLFESWFSEYNSAHRGTKQQMRDAYAAGMGDPKAQPTPTPQADSQPAPVAQGEAEHRQMDAKHAAIYRWMLSNVPDAWNIINNWCLYAEAGTDELHDALAARAQAKEGAQHG